MDPTPTPQTESRTRRLASLLMFSIVVTLALLTIVLSGIDAGLHWYLKGDPWFAVIWAVCWSFFAWAINRSYRFWKSVACPNGVANNRGVRVPAEGESSSLVSSSSLSTTRTGDAL